jgi:pimeloyl-ACP methyl ester carboxylesterase
VEQIRASHQRPGAIAAALAVARGMDLDTFDKQYSKIHQSSLLLWGKQDTVALPFYGKRLVSELPKAQLVLLDRCGHLPMLEQPFLVHRYIGSFLGSARQFAMQRTP